MWEQTLAKIRDGLGISPRKQRDLSKVQTQACVDLKSEKSVNTGHSLVTRAGAIWKGGGSRGKVEASCYS